MQEHSSRYVGLSFDEYVARYYLNKIKNARDRNLEFSLTLQEVKNMLRAKKCQLTGVELTHTGAGTVDASSSQRHSDLTLDRIDNTKGYVQGNVMACCYAANHVKSAIEGSSSLKATGLTVIEFIHAMSNTFTKKGFK